MRGISKVRAAVLSVLVLVAFFLTAGSIKPAAAFVFEKAEEARIQRITADYIVKESESFVIRFSKPDAGVIHRVSEQAESQLVLAADYFCYKPEQKILLTLYHDKNHLQKGLRLPSGGTTLGAYYAGAIGVLSPNVWGYEGDAAEKGLYLHELTHLIMADMAGGNYPLWFTEGMALYQEYLNTGFEWGKEYGFEGLPYTAEELTGDFSRLDQFLAYKQSFLLVKALAESEDRDRILMLFGTLGENVPFNAAFRQTFGYTPEKLWDLADKSFKK